jgi:hypothetical protein
LAVMAWANIRGHVSMVVARHYSAAMLWRIARLIERQQAAIDLYQCLFAPCDLLVRLASGSK